MIPRVGIGYDVHRFAEGRDLVLGGVTIPYHKGLDGHSDADVLCHAIADAVLGALGEPDIGYFFPPSDPSIRGISSLEILRKVKNRADILGATMGNIDATLVAEAPKIAPYREQMKLYIAEALGMNPSQVGIKATTNEGMGFVGRDEGMAAMATACVLFPPAL
jgi:2-C-methyl-D-erythritol 2,4-cyclodiphosphate synthase